MMKVVLLAAGLSMRMGRVNKLTEPIAGSCLLEIAILNALSYTNDVMVITGHDRRRTEAIAGAHGVGTIFNSGYAAGQETSIRAAAEAVDGPVMILPADLPFITCGIYRECERHLASHDVARPVFKGRPGHPVALSCHALTLYRAGTMDLKDLARQLDHDFYEVAGDDVIRDVDTPEDFARISSLLARQ